MGRARHGTLGVAAPGFEAVFGNRRGTRPPSEEAIEAAAAKLMQIGNFHEGYWPRDEALAILTAPSVSRANAALCELTGLADEDFSEYVHAAMEAAARADSVDDAEREQSPRRVRKVSANSLPKPHDPFDQVFGLQRGSGDTRLDGEVVSASARMNLTRVLERAGGELTEAWDLLSRHRQALEAPLVKELLEGVVVVSCAHEARSRREWLQEFVHSTVRDGRDGRILRVQMSSRNPAVSGSKSVFELHLRPQADVDTPSFIPNAKIPTACGREIGLQRAPVGAWSNETNEVAVYYHHCPVCARHAGLVPETQICEASALSPTESALLAAAHQTSTRSKIESALRRPPSRTELTSADLKKITQKTYTVAAVEAAATYALAGGDARLKTFCNEVGLLAAEHWARENGYRGQMVDLLSHDFMIESLRTRTPRRSHKSPQGQRRNLFGAHILEEIDHKVWYIIEGLTGS